MALNQVGNGLWLLRQVWPFPFKKKARTYIVPTGFGLAFGGMAFVLLFMAIGYANNLIYLYVFGLISMAMTSMYVTNKNMVRLKIASLQEAELYAEETGRVFVSLENGTHQDSLKLECFFRGAREEEKVSVPVALGGKTTVVSVLWKPSQRGEVVLPPLVVESRFPFGILRAWKIGRFERKTFVYPQRKGAKEFPRSVQKDSDQGQIGLFRDHRPYQSTDSLRRIDWRATARAQSLLVKNFEGVDSAGLSFKWEQTRHLKDFEARLSQLSLWLSEAAVLKVPYSLEIGRFKTASSLGPAHGRLCMEFLARVKEEDLVS